MSIFSDITKWVKGWRLDKFFKGLVNGDKQAAADLQATVEQANDFVNKVKDWVASPIGDVLTAVIPGEWDNDLREKAKQVLDIITTNNGALVGCLQKPSVGEQLTCIYSKIAAVADPNKQKTFWQEVGTTATLVFADGQLTWSDAVFAAKLVYEFVTKKK